MRMQHYDLIIVGGGAAGLAAAITASSDQNRLKVALLEKNNDFGKKLRATGNGRANISNRKIIGFEETIAFFNAMGVLTKWDDQDRIYPFFESAPQLTEIMIGQAQKQGCQLVSNAIVTKIQRHQDGFFVETGQCRYAAQKVILATGGKAGPMYGCSGDGYGLAKSLGHQVTKTLPVLTGVAVEAISPELKGVRQKGLVTLARDGSPVFSEWGEVQFTEYGLSGICIFNLSRFLTFVGDLGLSPYTILIDLCPQNDDNPQSLNLFFEKQVSDQSECDARTVSEVLQGCFKRPIVTAVLGQAGLDGERIWSNLNRAEKEMLVDVVHHLSFKPTGTMGFKQAQCTSGGIFRSEVEEKDGKSRLVPGLFFAGEILDYDGPCGGYNLDHAFRSGIAAASGAVGEISINRVGE